MTYLELKEECKNIYVEISQGLRMGRIAMFHLIGKVLCENDFDTKKIPSLAAYLGVGIDDIAFAIIFFEKYPKFKDFEKKQDKTASWSQVKQDLNEEEKK